MDNTWKDISGYEGYYMISTSGLVKSLSRPIYRKNSKRIHYYQQEHILKPRQNIHGYDFVTLHKDCRKKQISIHRLVALNFIDNKNKLNYINHKDHDIKNNSVSNLEWVTNAENIRYRKKQLKKTTSKYKGVYFHKKNKKWIAYISPGGKAKYLGAFSNESDAASRYDKEAVILYGKYALTNKDLNA